MINIWVQDLIITFSVFEIADYSTEILIFHSSSTKTDRGKKFLQDYNKNKDFLDKMKIEYGHVN